MIESFSVPCLLKVLDTVDTRATTQTKKQIDDRKNKKSSKNLTQSASKRQRLAKHVFKCLQNGASVDEFVGSVESVVLLQQRQGKIFVVLGGGGGGSVRSVRSPRALGPQRGSQRCTATGSTSATGPSGLPEVAQMDQLHEENLIVVYL